MSGLESVPGDPELDVRHSDISPTAKKQKTAVACNECRTRKVKCDGTRPVCSTCERRSARCVYTSEESKQELRKCISELRSENEDLKAQKSLSPSGGSPSATATTPAVEQLTSGSPTQGDTWASTSRRPTSPALRRASSLQNRTTQQINTHDNLDKSVVSTPAHAIQDAPVRNCYQETPSTYSQTSSARPQSSRRSPDCGQHQRDQHLDGGVSAMMGAVEEEQPTQGFFGGSSAGSFMRQIRTAVDRKVAPIEDQMSESVSGNTQSTTTFMESRNRDDNRIRMANHDLPRRKIADKLMEVYWLAVFPLYPLLNRSQMEAEYANIWTGKNVDSDENMLMCQINVIFALSCQLADFIEPEKREVSSEAYFSRAKELLHFSLWQSGSTRLIQCLLLMVQYLQSTDSAHQCWNVVGLAIRNAQSLGLHLPQTTSQLQSFHEQQLVRKIWHGCILMDRVVAMTFGRPAMISRESGQAVPLPVAIDEEDIQQSSQLDHTPSASGRPSMMSFYIKSLELYEIMNDVLLTLYGLPPEESSQASHDFYFNNSETNEGEPTIFDLDRALTKWCQNLPSHLRDPPKVSDNIIFSRQAIVLRARFFHVRILLFRPTLARYCMSRDSPTPTADPLISSVDSFPQRVALQCSVICVKVAQDTIDLIFDHIPADHSSTTLPAWWYNVLYVYTAATILIAARLRNPILTEVTESGLQRSWDRALEILRKYESYSNSARRCVAALEILHERVVSGAHHPQTMPETENQGYTNDPSKTPEIVSVPHRAIDKSLGEGMNAVFLDGFDFANLQDMSWLNSVPSSLY